MPLGRCQRCGHWWVPGQAGSGQGIGMDWRDPVLPVLPQPHPQRTACPLLGHHRTPRQDLRGRPRDRPQGLGDRTTASPAPALHGRRPKRHRLPGRRERPRAGRPQTGHCPADPPRAGRPADPAADLRPLTLATAGPSGHRHPGTRRALRLAALVLLLGIPCGSPDYFRPCGRPPPSTHPRRARAPLTSPSSASVTATPCRPNPARTAFTSVAAFGRRRICGRGRRQG